MTAVQQQVMELIPRITDEKLYYVLQLLNGVNGLIAKPDAQEITKRRPRIIGIARGQKYCSEDYDFDAEDPEITAMFEDNLQDMNAKQETLNGVGRRNYHEEICQRTA